MSIEEDEGPNMEFMLKRSLLSRSKLATITHDLDGLTHYICIECQAQYEDKEELEVHLCTHYKEYRFLCGICGTGLKRREHLDRHMQGHMELRPHVCDECGKGFKRKEHLNIHKSIHKGEKTLQCTICCKCFYRKDHLQKHVQTHNKHFIEHNIIPMNDAELTIKQEIEEDVKPNISDLSENCTDNDMSMESEDYSNSEFISEMPLEHSLTIDHVRLARPFVCVICGKSYKRKDHLKIHSWTHMKKEVQCSQCSKRFHTEDQMMVHVNLVHLKVHENGSGNIKQLKSVFGEQIDIEVMKKSVTPSVRKTSADGRNHECNICHRKFKRKQHLKVHANVHLKNKRTFFCGVCHEGFYDNFQFEVHQCQQSEFLEMQSMSVVGEQAGERDASDCSDAPSPASPAYNSEDAKKENYPQDLLEVVVEESNIPTPQRVFVCKFCGKPFRRKDHYKIHLNIHTGVKSFFCPTCGKGFYRKDHLQKHMIVHARSHMKKQKGEASAAAKQAPNGWAPNGITSNRAASYGTPNGKAPNGMALNGMAPNGMAPNGRAPIGVAANTRARNASKRQIPALLPLTQKKEIKPEITIHAPSSAKLRVPLQMKVPYQMVMSLDNGETRAVTVDPSTTRLPYHHVDVNDYLNDDQMEEDHVEQDHIEEVHVEEVHVDEVHVDEVHVDEDQGEEDNADDDQPVDDDDDDEAEHILP